MPGTAFREEAEQEGQGQGDREIRVCGIWQCKGPGVEGHRTLEGADCSSIGSGGAGVGAPVGRRPGQSPEAILQGLPPGLASVLHSLALPGGPLG